MIRHAAYLLWPVALVFTALTAFAFLAGAAIPPSARLDFAVIVFIAVFQMLMASVILQRMHGWDWLSLSFCAVFFSMSFVFLFAASRRLWPVFVERNLEVLLWSVRIPLLCALIWATVMLIVTPDPEIEQKRQRAVQRREGRAEGRTVGHAEGVAQEQDDQHERERRKR